MDKGKFALAQDLAERPYQTMTFLDRTTEGEPVYVALIPELPGCASHGKTANEAQELLDEAKVEFIYFMLEDGLTVPDPKLLDQEQRINVSNYMENIMDRVDKLAAPRGELLTSVT
ncbi:MAG: type II toxin-antitoxin system HicB family antitoxin [Chloroflexi bacterium]|nr:type II toxin-antitoxin system HicB family antitoxin [Chloroflexota bacterium]